MRLASVRIQNFRAFADTTVLFDRYTCLVGPNGGGKSTVLTALNVFFRETSDARTDLEKLDAQDFHHGNTGEPVVITVSFDSLSAEAAEDLKEYVRHGVLTVSAVANWSAEDGYAQVVQRGERLGIDAFKPFFKDAGDGASVTDLKKVYASIREAHSELPPPSTKQGMIDNLRAYEASHSHDCILIPSEDQFYGFSRGANRLAKYIQWVFVPAVKDATEEQLEGSGTLLGKLLARTVRTKVSFREPMRALQVEVDGKYQTILDGQQHELESLSTSLTTRLGEWARPGTSLTLQWLGEPGKSIKIAEPVAHFVIGEGDFKGQLARVGHGCQRSFIIALLEELAGSTSQDAPRLLLGCEEPELYQHPPQARHLAGVMERLSAGDSQVIVCTHSPYFVSGRLVESVRLIRSVVLNRCSTCQSVRLSAIASDVAAARGEAPATPIGTLLRVQQALQPALNEIFFTDALVLVEGVEDAAFLSAYLTLTDRWEAFRKAGGHIVAADGKSSMVQPLAIANRLQIPTFVVFDSDGHNVASVEEAERWEAMTGAQRTDEGNRALKLRVDRRGLHKRDNLAIQTLSGVTAQDPFPASTMWHSNLVMWSTEIGSAVSDDFAPGIWDQFGDEVRNRFAIDVGNVNKNSMFIGYRLAAMWDAGERSSSLERLCVAILSFAESTRRPTAQARNAPPATDARSTAAAAAT